MIFSKPAIGYAQTPIEIDQKELICNFPIFLIACDPIIPPETQQLLFI